MRTFSLFVSALALANLAQATPLNYELAQLDAEVDLEAELPLRPDGAKRLEDWMTKYSNLAINGAPFTAKDVEKTGWKETSDSWEGKTWKYTVNEKTSSLNPADLLKDGQAIKKDKQIYNS